MSLFSALTVAVGGLAAQSASIGNISNNLANAQTTGYKGVDTNFEALVTESNASVNDPGGVQARPLYQNDLQGNIVAATSSTSLAISGQGFFAVRPAVVAADGTSTFSGTTYYTRQGDFSLNKDGYLVNSSGYYLTGYPVDTNGSVNTSAANPIQLSELLDNPVETTTASYSANLPSSTTSTLASPFSSAASSINVYDLLGNQHAMSFTWSKQASDSDLAATAAVQTNCLTLASKSQGTFGNGVSITLSAGTTASTTKATLSVAGQASEVFDNIAGTGNTLWTNMAAAINGANVAATYTIPGDMTFTAVNKGTVGNNISVAFSAGSGGTTTATISNNMGVTETYANIAGGGTSAFWTNLASAISGAPSALVTATAVGGADAPGVTSYNLAGGESPSRLVSAVAGAGTAAPILATPTSLAGGTGTAVDYTAMATVGTSDMTLSALSNGTNGNKISMTFATGTGGTGTKATITDGTTTETYDNITGAGATFWTNLTKAINNKPSALVIANAGGGSGAPTVPSTVTLSGGQTPLPSSNVWLLNVSVPGGNGVDALTQAPLDYKATIPFIFNSTTVGTTAAGTIEAINPDTGTGASGAYTATTTGLANVVLPLSFKGVGAQNISVNFGTFGSSSSGVTQFADTSVSVSSFDQNGIPRGSFQGLGIDNNGFVTLNYNNGQNRTIAQVPIVQFFAQDQLQNVTGGAFAATLASGNARLSAPGANGAGSIVGTSLESSNVDIAKQFTKLIQAQQIYAANAKTVTTTDSMLQDALNIIR